MKKQYVVIFEHATRTNYAPRYLTSITNGYPMKTTEIDQATTFNTKAAAREAIRTIGKNNLYNLHADVVCC